MKIIYVTPHLSTGGMPEYLRNKIELLLPDNEVWVVEKSFEPAYRTVRDKIQALIGKNLVSLGGNLQLLPNLIKQISPDVVHFEELADYHFSDDILDQIYTVNRTWKIFETLHDSSIDSDEKRYLPDKMLVVSPWQIKNFLDLNIPIEIIQHEIKPGTKNRDKGLTKLGLDINKKHVLQVGLFSVRKNQSETIEIAKKMPHIQFHFIGAQTENYSSYWKPLLENLPSNCIIWGERPDPETFYSCMDMVIFPSRGNYGDRETNPLVIRESIAWEVPLLVRDLPFYLGMYNESDKVKFMSDDININVDKINDLLKIKNLTMEQEQTQSLDKNLFKKKLFNITFNHETNRINFEYLESTPLKAFVCVRDIDSEVPIYSFNGEWNQGVTFWCVPIPPRHYNFSSNPNFGGFLYDFYIDGVKVYSATTRIKTTTIKKVKYRVDSFDPLFVNYEQFFTDKIYESFFNEIENLDNVLDVGANVGLFTKFCLDKGAKKVISVEINQKAIDTFKSIYKENESVKLIEKAVCTTPNQVELYLDPSNSLVGSINQNHTNNLSDKQFVETITLDEIFDTNSIENLSLLKMDIEGAEYDAMLSVSDENLNKVEFLLMEFHDNYGGVLRENILNRLENAGFEYNLYQDNCIGYANEYEESGTIFAKNKNI